MYEELFVPLDEAAAEIECSRQHLYRLSKQGKLTLVKRGIHTYVTQRSLDDFLCPEPIHPQGPTRLEALISAVGLLTVKEASELLGVTERHVRRLGKKGRFLMYTKQERLYVESTSLKRYLHRLEEYPADVPPYLDALEHRVRYLECLIEHLAVADREVDAWLQ